MYLNLILQSRYGRATAGTGPYNTTITGKGETRVSQIYPLREMNNSSVEHR